MKEERGYLKISVLGRNFIGSMDYQDMILRSESSWTDFENNIYAKI